uniref:Uncharacterized protein n=1 Tax=Dromaius novaehollandiae TaxID=8790 RepID=A0A8C4KYG8_DRONO
MLRLKHSKLCPRRINHKLTVPIPPRQRCLLQFRLQITPSRTHTRHHLTLFKPKLHFLLEELRTGDKKTSVHLRHVRAAAGGFVVGALTAGRRITGLYFWLKTK